MRFYKNDIEKQGREIFRKQGERIGKLLDPYHIDEDDIETVLEYAIGMQAHYPLMKQERVVRKTVDHFHLKLKPKGN